ncbi:MAG: SUMF1/EgtB/PvdO family nonheme iron enzyme [Verrucomicrobiota bacterium]|nr:SUMF1/EgtB/PvdO family nonheme iron enzyme [Limisphaera sp.]MDW8381218.1 SUMF1/EgtB/PvdO family nonheme iron enzyme [Verrucomicrobiota bacterium]
MMGEWIGRFRKGMEFPGRVRLGGGLLAVYLVCFAPWCIAAGQVDTDFRAWVYETAVEFLATGDFDGDNRVDVVIVDKSSGKCRFAYQLQPGQYTWAEDNRPSGVRGVTGVSVGRLIQTDRDALAITSADANLLVILESPSPQMVAQPREIHLEVMGPNAVLACDIGGEGNTVLDDLVVASMYNSPDPYLLTVFRNTGRGLQALDQITMDQPATLPNRSVLRPDLPAVALGMVGDPPTELVMSRFDTGRPEVLARLTDLPPRSVYTLGRLREEALMDLLLYQPGSAEIRVRSILRVERFGVEFGPETRFDWHRPIDLVCVVPGPAPQRLLIVSDAGQRVSWVQIRGERLEIAAEILAEVERFTGALPVPEGAFLFLAPTNNKPSWRYQFCTSGGQTEGQPSGLLPSLADSDVATIPAIYQAIMANRDVQTEAEMKPYTNTIPGTQVRYVMVPVPGGEFIMGSREEDPEGRPDERPAHRVRISPFWIGMFEVTWNEFELFMYPEDEKRLRQEMGGQNPTDPLADAVARPSKPYTEMSFGMGKDGYPAISMTHHAANKYCQWLSAKTGHFYRLPTEAEWEYACRAGTTNAYSFGDDPALLDQYAWYEDNSDFKYHKVGRKRPNPWGLYDMHGNVAEWCLDQYEPYQKLLAPGMDVLINPWNRATRPYPHVTRGGSFDDPPWRLRSAARRPSDRSWKMRDPQLPKSIWWLTDAPFVGFRIVRPLEVPPPEEMKRYWISGTERD